MRMQSGVAGKAKHCSTADCCLAAMIFRKDEGKSQIPRISSISFLQSQPNIIPSLGVLASSGWDCASGNEDLGRTPAGAARHSEMHPS